MSNIIYIKKDPILIELDDSVDKKSAKRMIAFKYFNNNETLLNEYLNKNNSNNSNSSGLINNKSVEPKAQLEFSF
tara:strand:- start:112 stop:336 length:225 start_codon:yes stop_codon:yes gene_type:complete